MSAKNKAASKLLKQMNFTYNECSQVWEAPGIVRKDQRVHTVQAGETLRSISLDYYGTARYHLSIFGENANCVIVTDYHLRPGMKLVIPNVQAY